MLRLLAIAAVPTLLPYDTPGLQISVLTLILSASLAHQVGAHMPKPGASLDGR